MSLLISSCHNQHRVKETSGHDTIHVFIITSTCLLDHFLPHISHTLLPATGLNICSQEMLRNMWLPIKASTSHHHSLSILILYTCPLYIHASLHSYPLYIHASLHSYPLYIHASLHSCPLYIHASLHTPPLYIHASLHSCSLYCLPTYPSSIYLCLPPHLSSIYPCLPTHLSSIYPCHPIHLSSRAMPFYTPLLYISMFPTRVAYDCRYLFLTLDHTTYLLIPNLNTFTIVINSASLLLRTQLLRT